MKKSGEDVRTIPTALIDSNKTVNVKFKSFKFMKFYRITHGGQKPWTKIFSDYETNYHSVIWKSDGDERHNLLAEHQTKPVGEELLADRYLQVD